MSRRLAALLFIIAGLFIGIRAAAAEEAAKPLESLCRDYRELTERRPMVDRQQVALLPKFEMLEGVCLNESKPAALSNYACTFPSKAPVRVSCCAGPWDCLKSSQGSCDSMEKLCKSLGAGWAKE